MGLIIAYISRVSVWECVIFKHISSIRVINAQKLNSLYIHSVKCVHIGSKITCPMRKTRSIIALNMSHSDNMSTADILTRLKCVAGWMLLIVLADALPLLRADPGSNVNQNFKSVPTTVKTFAGDTVHLPCRHRCECAMCAYGNSQKNAFNNRQHKNTKCS